MRLKECRSDSECPQATPFCQVGKCNGMFCYNANNEVIKILTIGADQRPQSQHLIEQIDQQ